MGSLALLPLGYLLAGPLGDAFGDANVLTVGGIVGTGVMTLALVPRSTRTMLRIDEPEPLTPSLISH
jgi:hypothetical protein